MRRLATAASIACLIMSGIAPLVAQGIITTVTGAEWVFPASVTVAKNAPLGNITGVAYDTQGNFYVADPGNARVFRVGLNGSIRIVAGNGINGFSGDGGPGPAASLSSFTHGGEPMGVAVDASGNIYISDPFNNRIRKVSTIGIITTFAGSGNYGFSGDGGPATAASFQGISGVAVDTLGNLFIADSFNNRIRRVSPNGVITTVAGGGNPASGIGDGGPATSASLADPEGVAVDSSGSIFIADLGNSRIRKVLPGGTIITVAGGGALLSDGVQATSASLSLPIGVAVDSAGNLYIADTYDYKIRRVNTSGVITTIAGLGSLGFSGDGGPAIAAAIHRVTGVAVDPFGNVILADSPNQRVRQISTDGIINTIAGNGKFRFIGDGGPANAAPLRDPTGVAADPMGNFYIADAANLRIRKVSSSGVITTIAGNGTDGFSGDGGPALLAALSDLLSLAADSAGNVYFADFYRARVRRVSADGTISTIAGNGVSGFSGDGGPATSAMLSNPQGVAVDSSGNLYIADYSNNRIRKVSASGIISTVAGNGARGFSGDGGPAISAMLNGPYDVAVDSLGALYIADRSNNRVRKVSTSGTISTVAGNGTGGASGDGGPAIAAALDQPRSIGVDPFGNLFIGDNSNPNIRKVSASGLITRFAGNGDIGFSGDGGPATEASLQYAFGIAADPVGNLLIADSGSNRVRRVLGTAPVVTTSPASLTFSLALGDSAIGQIGVSSTVPGLSWSAASSANWITLNPGSGSTPGGISARISTTSLQPGTYTAIITISNPLALPTQETVSVSLTVVPVTASLSVSPAILNFQLPQFANDQRQAIAISSAGGGALNWTAQADAASPWISVSPASGSASVADNASLQVTTSSKGLSPGVYTGTITITSPTTSTSSKVTVNLLVTSSAPTILLSQTSLTFTGIEGGGAIPSQSLAVLNTGGGSMNWIAIVGSPTPWLAIPQSSSSGTSIANSASPPMLQVNADASGMVAGKYVGQIQVFASGASNTPQIVLVLLNVLPKGSSLPPIIQPTSLVFVRQAGSSSPGSQTIFVSSARPETTSATPSVAANPAFPITLAPTNFAVTSSQAGQFIVQPTLGSLAPGTYSTNITIQSSDSSGLTNQNVAVLFVVTAGPTSSSKPGGALRAEAFSGAADPACSAATLTVTLQSLNSSFSASVGAAKQIQAKVVDNCNILVDGASVTANFQYSDSSLTMASISNGLYEASWQPGKAGPQNVTITATSGSLKGQTTSPLSGNVSGSSQIATTFTNAASFVANTALAPGSLISVFGQNLANSTLGAGFPIPTSLGGAQLNIGGQNVPLLFASPGQVNAQIPLSISPNSATTAYFVVNQNAGSFLGQQGVVGQQSLVMAQASPGIFVTDPANVNGQGAITDAKGAILNSGNPAARGQIIIIFATGLGAVINPPALGAAAGSTSTTIATPTVTIGGLPADVKFSGLAPGFVGLYQINVAIPGNVALGASVPVVITQSGFSSNSATIVVR